MATAYYGAQYTDAFVDVPSDKIQQGDNGGKPRREFFSWAVPAAAITISSTVNLCKIPKGARVYNAVLEFPDQGTTGTATLGWLIAAELDSSGTTLEIADADGLLTTVDLKTAADSVSMRQQMEAGGSNAGSMKKFAAEVVVQLAISEAFDVGVGTIKGYVEYIID